MLFSIRHEQSEDAQIIRMITEAAFATAEHSSGTEGAILEALRKANALAVSLVATIGEEVVGHVAFSCVKVDGAEVGWFGLGPVAVRPDLHGQGLGSALIREGLEHLRSLDARGCVVLGDPTYYQRFGFSCDPALRLDNVPPEYFMRLSLDGSTASGRVTYHEGFSAL